jgi:hypothetical protein
MKLISLLTGCAGATAAAAALVLAVPSVATAASPQRSAREITASVMNSSDPQTALRALSTTDRAAFVYAFRHQTSTTVVDRGGRYTPTKAQRAAMHQTAAPSSVKALAGTSAVAAASGCWYHYYQKSWSDLGIHDGDSWMQLNWCGSGGKITSWRQSNVGCAGHHGASCSVGSKAERNVGWEIRSTRYFNANFFGFSNTFCQQIRGGATGLYSTRSSNSGVCSLS